MDFPADLLVDLRERMVRIETKLDTHSETHTTLRTDVDDLKERTGKLEGNQRILVAVGSIVLFLVTFFQNAITNAIGM